MALSVSKFAQGMTEVQKDLRKFGRLAEDTGKSLTQSITLPLVGMAAGALKVSGDFESAMIKVQQRTGATGDDLKAMSALAVQMGVDTVFSATESAQAMEEMHKAGFSVKEIMAALPAVTHLAAAENMSLADAVGAVDQVLDTFGLSAEHAAGVADILTTASQGTEGGVKDLQAALSAAGTIAVTSGMSFQEEVGILRALQDVGVDAAKSGSDLKQALQKLLDPTKQGTAALDRLGVSVLDGNGKMKPFRQILDEIGQTSATSADFMDIFGKKAGPDLEALVRRGSAGLKDIEDKLNDAGGAAKEAGNTGMLGFNGAIEKIKGALEALGIAIGASGFLKWMTDALNKVGDFVRFLSQTKPQMLQPFIELAALIGVAGPVLLGAGMLAKAFGKGGIVLKAFETCKAGLTLFAKGIALLFSPTGLMVVAIVAGAILIMAYWDEIRDGFKAVGKAVADEAERIKKKDLELLDSHKSMASSIAAADVELLRGIQDGSKSIINTNTTTGESFKSFGERVKGVMESAKAEIGKLVPAMDDAADGMNSSLTGMATKLTDGAKSFFTDFIARWQQRTADLVTAFKNGIAPLPAKMTETLEATKQAWLVKIPELLVGFQHSGKQVYDSFTGPVEGIVDAVREFGSDAFEAFSDATDDARTGAPFRNWEAFWEDVSTRTGSIVSDLASDIADVILTGEGSIVDTFEKAGERLLHAVLETIINKVLNILIEKITQLIGLLDFGNPFGKASGGMTAGAGGGSGIGDGLVGLGEQGGVSAMGMAFAILREVVGAAMRTGGKVADTAKSVIAELFGGQGPHGRPGVLSPFFGDPANWLHGPALLQWFLQHGLPDIPGWINNPWNPGGFVPPGPGGIVAPPMPPGDIGGPGGVYGMMAGGGLVINVNVGGSVWQTNDLAEAIRERFIDIFNRTGDLGFT